MTLELKTVCLCPGISALSESIVFCLNESTYLLLEQSPAYPTSKGYGQPLPCCCFQYVNERFFMTATGFFSESECKGTTIPRTDKIFYRLFSKNMQLFSCACRRTAQNAGGRKHTGTKRCAIDTEKRRNNSIYNGCLFTISSDRCGHNRFRSA